MFIPRQIKRKLPTPIAKDRTSSQGLDESAEAVPPAKKIRVDTTITEIGDSREGSSESTADRNYNRQLLCGLELILSDYHHASPESGKWLRERERVVDGKDGFIHLSAFLDHKVFSRTKPAPTQKALQRALNSSRSKTLKLSEDAHHLRVAPSQVGTTLMPSSPSTLDAHTVYVEPHLSSLAANPPALLQHLLDSSELPSHLLPVQTVTSRHPAWVFITFFSPVEEGLVADRRRWPTDWIVLNKAEHARRDAEYASMVAEQSHSLLPRAAPVVQISQPPKPAKTLLSPSDPSTSYPPSHLVLLHNVHPATTKPTITAFVTHNVAAYYAHHPSRAPKKSDENTPQAVKVAHIEYTSNTSTAIMRASSAEDAHMMVTALRERPRAMRGGEDGRGKKPAAAGGLGEPKLVEAEILRGERERVFWERVWEGKRRGAKKRRTRRDGGGGGNGTPSHPTSG